MDMGEINGKVVEQSRSGGAVEGMDHDRLPLLTTTGRRTNGAARTDRHAAASAARTWRLLQPIWATG